MTDSHSDEEKARQELERKKAWDKARNNSVMDRLGEKLFAGTDKERTNVISVAEKVSG